MNGFDRKEIKKLALSYMQYSTYDPVEAVIMALETFLNKKNIMLVPNLPTGNQQGQADPKGRRGPT